MAPISLPQTTLHRAPASGSRMWQRTRRGLQDHQNLAVKHFCGPETQAQFPVANSSPRPKIQVDWGPEVLVLWAPRKAPAAHSWQPHPDWCLVGGSMGWVTGLRRGGRGHWSCCSKRSLDLHLWSSFWAAIPLPRQCDSNIVAWTGEKASGYREVKLRYG